jgi:hypothetical protein
VLLAHVALRSYRNQSVFFFRSDVARRESGFGVFGDTGDELAVVSPLDIDRTVFGNLASRSAIVVAAKLRSGFGKRFIGPCQIFTIRNGTASDGEHDPAQYAAKQDIRVHRSSP